MDKNLTPNRPVGSKKSDEFWQQAADRSATPSVRSDWLGRDGTTAGTCRTCPVSTGSVSRLPSVPAPLAPAVSVPGPEAKRPLSSYLQQ